MKKAIKWISLLFLGLVLVVILAALIVPKFIDVAKYRPQIEKQVSEASGRPFAIEGDLSLSIFPKTRLSFSDLKLGNRSGFEGRHFLSVDFFDAQLKLIPLVFGEVEIERFRVENLRVALEKNKSGQGNWEGLMNPVDVPPAHEGSKGKEPPVSAAGGGLTIDSLSVKEFVIAGASVQWTDHGKGQRRELSGINLTLTDLSLEQPIGIDFSAKMDGNPVTVKGRIGPVGQDPGRGSLPLDIAVGILGQAQVSLRGTVTDLAERQAFDLELALSPFSPRELARAAGVDIPLKTADPAALGRLSLKVAAAGTPTEVVLSDGFVELDDTRVALAATVKEFTRPDVSLDLKIDRIDLNRYLPPDKKAPSAKQTRPSPAAVEKSVSKSTDYDWLKSLSLKASLSIGQLILPRVVAEDLSVKVNAKKGLFRVEPAEMKISQGRVAANGLLDVSAPVPASRFELKADGVQAGPLLLALLGRDILEGEARARAAVSMRGHRPGEIKKSLTGTGELLFQKGEIKGVDLVAIMNAAEGALDVSLNQGAAARTEFSELRVPFRLSRGVAQTDETTLITPLITASASGTANLVTESLDLRIEPQVAYVVKEKGKDQQTEIRVPVLVGGTFSDPVFRPDLKAIAKDQLEKRVFESKEFKKIFEKEELKPLEGAAKGLLKGLFSQ